MWRLRPRSPAGSSPPLSSRLSAWWQRPTQLNSRHGGWRAGQGSGPVAATVLTTPRADFTWRMTAIDWGHAPEEVACRLMEEGDFGVAKAVLQKLSAQHVDVLETEARLGEFLSNTSQYAEGLRHLANALAVGLELKGPDDAFFTPQIWLMYGEALTESGHFEEGLASISRAVENRRKNRPGTRYLGQMLISQASALADLGEYEKARLCLDEAALLSTKAGYKLNAGYAVARLKLAFDGKRPEEASATIESFYGPVPDAASLSLDLLGNLTARAQLALITNDSRGALLWATRLSDAVTASPNRKYLRQWEVRAAMEQGSAWLEMHHPEQALEPLMRAERLAGEVYDSASAELIPAKAALGVAYLEMGNRSESMKLLAQAESIHKSHLHRRALG